MMQLDWYRCKGAVWCDLFKVNLENPIIKKASGVYVIWSGDYTERNILKVGNGKIYAEFATAKNELAIQAFSHLGVFCTWTEVSSLKIRKVENFLIAALKPKLSGGIVKGGHVEVNVPWENEQEYRSADDGDDEEEEEDFFTALFGE